MSLLSFSPDSEAMGFLLQITMSCLRALLRQVAGAGAGSVSWLRAWWRQGAGAECRALAACVVEGAGAVSWQLQGY